jgi:ATP-dependent Clp protease ATP-binding subunit ClpA
MRVERLTQYLHLDGGEQFIILYGGFVNDLFCGLDLTVHHINITLWRFFQSQGYQRIIFYDGANRIYWYDAESRRLCLPNQSNETTQQPRPHIAGLAPGPAGGVKIRPGRCCRLQEPARTAAPPLSTDNAAPRPVRAISDPAALEILDHIIMRDLSSVSTALIFTHANDLSRRSLGGENTFREFQNRMVAWAQENPRQPNACVFIFQDKTRSALLETCQRNELTVLANFLEQQESHEKNVIEVKSPSAAELLRLIHRYRLERGMRVDWNLLSHLSVFLARQNIPLRSWQARLKRSMNMNKETLLEWSKQGFICAKEHIIHSMGEHMKLLNTEEIRKRMAQVVGQQDNTDILIREVSRWYGAPQHQKPLTVFMVGTSGVGKTYTVKLLAEALQAYGFDYCDFSMTEFSEEHRVSSLIGSPPGFVGSEDEPKIFLALRQSSRLVILFDEIEKAHDRVIKALMQLMDEGKLSWSKGQGDFRDCILCFTSNAQMEEMVALKQSTQKSGKSMEGPEFQNAVRDVLVRAHIAPEVCGRVDRFLIYNPLNIDSSVQIADQQVRCLAAGYNVNVQSIAPEFLAETALATAGSMYGARPIKNHVSITLGNSLIELLGQNPRTKNIRIERTDAGGYAVHASGDLVAEMQADEFEAAVRMCRELQRRERVLDQEILRQKLSRVHCQVDEINLLIQDVANWFGQAQKKRPLSFFLVGTSGVGKTHTCELLAQAMEAKGYAHEYFDMNLFGQQTDVNNLLGSATGFVGSEQIPKIFLALQRSSKLVIVFDEIEKAHPTILQTLMQLLDKGVLSWSKGEGDFKQCIICFTSNAQMVEMVRLKSSYLSLGRSTSGSDFQNAVRDILTRSGIAPEICGRINRFLVYNPLTADAVFHIALAEMQIFARSYELELVSCHPEILAEIAQSNSGSLYGTRPITQHIGAALGPLLLKFQARFPNATHIACQIGSAGYEIVTADPADPVSLETLMTEAKTRYLEMKHAMSFLDVEALLQTLSLVHCQDDNIHQLVERLELWYSQENKDRPLSLFLVGSSGVGKTYTAELLAEALRPYMYDFSYLNMSEFSQDFTVSNLIGSPRGYVGSEETPRLFADLERSSRLVILLDEIEKAHPTVFKTLMQLLDKGHLSWNKGVGDFRECIILLTSNIQMDALVRLKSGFNQRGQSSHGPEFQDAVKTILIEAGIAPELCGRINRFLVYNPLTPEATVRIVFQEIQKLCREQGYQVHWVSPELLAEIARVTAGSTSGSRAVRGQVESRLSRPMMGFKRQHVGEKTLRFESTQTNIQAVPASGDIDLQSQEDMLLQAIALLNGNIMKVEL